MLACWFFPLTRCLASGRKWVGALFSIDAGQNWAEGRLPRKTSDNTQNQEINRTVLLLLQYRSAQCEQANSPQRNLALSESLQFNLKTNICLVFSVFISRAVKFFRWLLWNIVLKMDSTINGNQVGFIVCMFKSKESWWADINRVLLIGWEISTSLAPYRYVYYGCCRVKLPCFDIETNYKVISQT